MPPTEPSNDIFYTIDFVDGDAKAPLKLKERLAKETPPSWVKRIEVYQVTPTIYYYNPDAILLSQGYDIDVPKEMMRKTRAEITWSGVDTIIKWP